jgi:hypothetical protein
MTQEEYDQLERRAVHAENKIRELEAELDLLQITDREIIDRLKARVAELERKLQNYGALMNYEARERKREAD